jgi:hypothetical protein
MMTDGREHRFRIPASFPAVMTIRIDSKPLFIATRRGESAYFLLDTNVNWTIVNSRLDATTGRPPVVVCRESGDPCPVGKVAAWDPPAVDDRRCPDPRNANSETAKLCYTPGEVMFVSDRPQEVDLVDVQLGGSDPLRTIVLEAGKASVWVPLEYERIRPIAVRIGKEEYVFAVGHAERWRVSIDRHGKLTARVVGQTPP